MLLFTEGFDWSTTVNDYTLLAKWLDRQNGAIGNTTLDLRFGVSSGNYWVGSSAADNIRRPIGQNLAAGIIGISYKSATTVNKNQNLIVLFDTTSTVQCGLKINTDGTLSVFRSTHSNILGTSTFAVGDNVWHYIEFKWAISDSISSGDVEVKVDGTVVLTVAASSDTKSSSNAYATHYAFVGNSPSVTSGRSGSNFFIDDHYLIDLTGSVNNTYLGNVRIQTLYPNGNGNSSQMVGSDGNSTNNFQLVDEASYAAADYVESATLNDKDTYTFTDTLSTTNTILGISINVAALRTNTDPRSIAPVVRHSGTDYDGTNIALSSSAVAYQQVYETNPGTSSGWTKSDVDGMEAGVKVTV
jgi:hypothetical protein